MMMAGGSLIGFGPFLLAKIPLIGKKLLGHGATTGYDKAGKCRHVMSRGSMYEKWKEAKEQGVETELVFEEGLQNGLQNLAENLGLSEKTQPKHERRDLRA